MGVIKKPERIAERLNSSEWKIRRECVYHLAEERTPSSLKLLVKATEDDDWHVRQAVVAALGKWFGSDKVPGSLPVPPSVKAKGELRSSAPTLDDFEEEGLQIRIVRATLVNALINDGNSHVRRAAAEGLGKLRDPLSLESLVRAVIGDPKSPRDKGDPVYIVCRAAVRALGNMGDRRAVGPLIKAIRHKEWEVRMEVANSLGKIGGASVVEPLAKLIEDEVSSVGKAATEALFMLLKDSKCPEVERFLGGLSPDSSYGKKRDVVMKAVRIYFEHMGTMKLDAKKVDQRMKRKLRKEQDTLPPSPGVRPLSFSKHR